MQGGVYAQDRRIEAHRRATGQLRSGSRTCTLCDCSCSVVPGDETATLDLKQAKTECSIGGLSGGGYDLVVRVPR